MKWAQRRKLIATPSQCQAIFGHLIDGILSGFLNSFLPFCAVREMFWAKYGEESFEADHMFGAFFKVRQVKDFDDRFEDEAGGRVSLGSEDFSQFLLDRFRSYVAFSFPLLYLCPYHLGCRGEDFYKLPIGEPREGFSPLSLEFVGIKVEFLLFLTVWYFSLIHPHCVDD